MTVHDGDAAQEAQALAAQLAEARARLREVDHRIKNDLQLIASVFVLQLRRLPEGPERELAAGALARVAAVSAVHRRLDVGGDPHRLEAAGLIGDLVQDATAQRPDIAVTLALAPVTIAARQAAPLALIASELIRNAVKHAFPGRAGTIEVALGAADGQVRLSVRDDGVGLAAEAPAPRGFGVTLAGLLAKQLRGELEVAGADPGLRAVVRFPEAR